MESKTKFKETEIGLIPEDWKRVQLSDIIEIIGGGTPKTTVPEYWGGNIPWLSVSDFNDDYRIVYSTDKTITEEGLSKSSTKILDKGDIIISARGTVGALAQLGRKMAFNQSCYGLKAKSNASSDFLYYMLKYKLHEIKNSVHGSVFDTITRKTFDILEIPLPELKEQEAISLILSTLDDKIELNRQMNETLEAMARAIFKSWFVDFDPVRAKAEGRDTGLPEEIADLFPDSFEETEVGEVPRGWHVRSIGDLAEVVGGSTPSTKEHAYWDNGIHHWATPKDLSSLSFPVLLSTERLINDAGLSQISSGLLPKGTVLLSSRAPIGYLAVTEVPVAINQGFIAMKSKTYVSNLFILLWASFAHEDILSRANGSTFLEISKSNFRPIPIATPTVDVINAFDKQVRPLYEKIVEHEIQSRTLAELRDTLLPKLISGEMRVKEAE
jgi:type I restriction enzyme S subunit